VVPFLAGRVREMAQWKVVSWPAGRRYENQLVTSILGSTSILESTLGIVHGFQDM
jgi:hypothetical protein